MKKILSLLLCISLVTGLFAGCKGEKDPYVPTGDALAAADADPNAQATEPALEQELTLVYYPDSSLHPYECTDYTNRTVLSLVYQSLFVVNDDYKVSPLLCKSYSVSDDMMTYTFYLKDATFSDGTPLTAQHVLGSLEAAWESNVYGYRFHQVLDMEVTSDGGIAIYLNTPYENFPILLDVPIIKTLPAAPAADSDDSGDTTTPTETAATEPETDNSALPLGTGPYYLDSTPAGMRLRRCLNWWCDLDIPVTASSISLREAESPTQVRDAFEFSDVGLVCANPGSDSYADFRSDYELWDIESGLFLYIGFNMDEEGESIFKDEDLRAAFTHAIDRDLLAEDYYRGYASSATLPASPNSPYYDEALAAQYAFDSELFAQEVIKGAYQGKEITMLVNAGDSLRLRVAKDIAAMLEDCGLTVKLTEYEGDYYYSAISAREYDIYLAQTKLSPNMDLTPFFYVYGSLSYGALDNESVYAMCQEALANDVNYYSLHKQVMDQGLICPILFQSYAVYATRGLLTGLTPARDNVFYYDFGERLSDIQIPVDEE